MVQTSVQFTPVQVLQAARRAEAEGKMDYALQFYRHLVEQHGGSPEAQEAREGLFRIAEWRWGEARVARTGGAPAAPQPQPQAPPGPPAASQRVYNVANNPSPAGYPADQHPQAAAAGPGAMPQIIARQQAAASEEAPLFLERFRMARYLAHALSGFGWLTLLGGLFSAGAGFAGFIGELSAIALLGAPFGVLLGVPAIVLGLVLVVAGQLAAALFESANATLELAAFERGRTGF